MIMKDLKKYQLSKSVRQMVKLRKYEENIIQPTQLEFRDKPVPLPRNKKPVPYPRTTITIRRIALNSGIESFKAGVNMNRSTI